MENEIIQVNQAQSLEAVTRSEIDIQVATAKRYPRDIENVLKRIEMLASRDRRTAADCFYCLKRSGKTIEGLSVRMAEIIASSWGNLRVASHVIGNDGKTITAQAVCIDLETNVAVSTEVKRRITTKDGRTYDEDMQVTTGNAACSIAMRNAVLRVIPKALTAEIIDRVKNVALGSAKALEDMRQEVFNWYAKSGITEADILELMDVSSREEITNEMVLELQGMANAIYEGTSTMDESVIKPLAEKRRAKVAKAEAKTNKDKVAKAMASSVKK